MSSKPTPLSRQPSLGRVRNYMLAGLAVSFAMVGGVGVWAARTELAGAVIASGLVVVESSVKKVQHPVGGVVGAIMVKNGDKVKTGDILLRLDETVTKANLQVISKQLDQLNGREARYKAERDMAKEITFPAAISSRADDPEVGEIMSGERTLFESRRDSREGQKAQLRERIGQLQEEFEGVSGQIEAKTREIELIGEEIRAMEELESKQLVTTQRRVQLRRDAARLNGELGALQASAAQTKGKISEIELQILRIDQDFRAELMTDLRETQGKQAELNERKIAAEDQLKRIDIRAPQNGVVHQMSVHTVGGVINPSEPVMMIVPEGDRLVIDAKVAPQDIDQVLRAETAIIRFPSFNQRTTPEVTAQMKRVAADLTHDDKTNESYYMARLEIPDSELTKLGEHKLFPGMPAEVQIRTSSRTALSYILKPLEDQISRAFKER